MGPQLQLSTYSQDFNHPGCTRPTRPRPTSSYRRNKPHVHPDFLLPRKPQTGYGCRPTFPKIEPTNKATHFPPVRHVSIQFPDVKALPSQSTLNPRDPCAESHSKPYKGSTVVDGTMPSAGWLPKPQPISNSNDRQCQGSVKNMQRPCVDHLGPSFRKHMDNITPLRAFSAQDKRYRSSSRSALISSGGYSCFHVVKPYKAGYYIIHPEFMSEMLH